MDITIKGSAEKLKIEEGHRRFIAQIQVLGHATVTDESGKKYIVKQQNGTYFAEPVN